jgi:hypothetical protein
MPVISVIGVIAWNWLMPSPPPVGRRHIDIDGNEWLIFGGWQMGGGDDGAGDGGGGYGGGGGGCGH